MAHSEWITAGGDLLRSQCSLYVDAGYLLAAAATRVTGTSLRSGVEVEHERLISSMIEQAESTSGLPLLRVNWYDSGAKGVPDRTQEQIGLLPRVKLRLGRLGYSGEQKGVDLRIGLDLVAHSRNGAVDLAYLVSGDDDLTEAVEEAQGHGVQVILLAVPDSLGAPHAVSRHLLREADGIEILKPADLDAAVTPAARTMPTVARSSSVPSGSAATPAALASRSRTIHSGRAAQETRLENTKLVYTSATTKNPSNDLGRDELTADATALMDSVCQSVLETWQQNSTSEARNQLIEGRPYIPADIDKALLLDMSAKLGIYDLEETKRFELRRRFWAHVDEALDV